MSHKLLRDARLHRALLQTDREIAGRTRAGGCPHCRAGLAEARRRRGDDERREPASPGDLHSARYRRKPRGAPAGLGDEYDWRFSFCCARHGCRKRVTPPSVRFLGRRVYLAVVVTLAAAMLQGVTRKRVALLAKELGADARTLESWRRWWLELFVRTPFWAYARGGFSPPVDEAALPSSLLERFAGDEGERLRALARFVAPLGAGTAGSSMGP